MKDKFWSMKMLSSNSAEIYIFGEIVPTGWEWDGDTSSNTFKKELDGLGDVGEINLHINSPGGSVFEGVAIMSMLKQHKAQINVYIDGLAASIASVIAMSGDTIFMPVNAMLMVHNPWNRVTGNAKDFRKAADDLDRIGKSMAQSYLMKAGEKLTEETLTKLLDDETWLTAQDALNYGLCDELLDTSNIAAKTSEALFKTYRNVPNAILNTESTKKESLKSKKIKMLKRGMNNE